MGSGELFGAGYLKGGAELLGLALRIAWAGLLEFHDFGSNVPTAD